MQDFSAIQAYCEAHTSLPLSLLDELERETYLKTLSPQMLSGRLVGQLLSLLTTFIRPKTALEIGTFTGYASLCIAKSLLEDGILHTIEINPEVQAIARRYFSQTAFQHKIHAHLGDARAIIPTLPQPFDLVFVDAAKFDYLDYYEMLVGKMAAGGVIIADNVLWSGKVLTDATDADTLGMKAFNERVQQDGRVENVMLPVRDGISIIRKR